MKMIICWYLLTILQISYFYPNRKIIDADDIGESYVYIKDICGNYFWTSKIYELLEKERNATDSKKDILHNLVVPEDKILYGFLVESAAVDEDNIIHIKTEKGTNKTLKIDSEHLCTSGPISQTIVYINDITEVNKPDDFLSNKLLTQLDAKLGAGTLIRNTKGEFIISNAFYDILHIPKKDITELLKDFRGYIVNRDARLIVQKFELTEMDNVEKVIEYKSPFYHKTQYLFIYLENYDDNLNNISFMGIKDVTGELEREKELEVSLNGQKVLLKEVHHRVKNNLQIILSLLNLELRFNDGDYEWILKKTRNRISSMATIHHQVFNSSDFAHVDSLEYTTLTLDYSKHMNLISN